MADQKQTNKQSEPRNGFGITALVLAIIGVVFGLVPFTGFLAFILGALAILFAFLGWGRVRRKVASNKKMTLIAGTLGAIATALGIWGMVIVFTATEEIGDELERAGEEIQQSVDELEQEIDNLQE